MDAFLLTAGIVILIFSVIIHEVSHGWVAHKLGDSTAKALGRLTLNPIPHIDILGSVIIPGFLLILNTGFLFGWAKPVPYNPLNLKDPDKGGAIIALSGPVINIIIGLTAGLSARLLHSQFSTDATEGVIVILGMIAVINFILAIFNLFPIPPLDGSKVLFAFVPISNEMKMQLERNGMLFVILFIFLFSAIFWEVVSAIIPPLVGPGVQDVLANALGWKF